MSSEVSEFQFSIVYVYDVPRCGRVGLVYIGKERTEVGLVCVA